MKNKTKLKKLGAPPVKQQPKYAIGTVMVDVRTSPKHRAFAEKMLTGSPRSKFINEGFSGIGRSYHVKPSLFKANHF